jgi:DNA gyrase inhibitor GyrI
MKTALIVTVALLSTLAIVVGCRTSRSAYATAPFKRARTSGKFELRDYPTLTLVETPMTDSDGNSGFGQLFRYITGRNEGAQKIAMTTPVFMSGDEHHPAMAFVMPAGLKTDQVPKPTDKSISVREVPADRFAVLSFSGGRNAKNEAAALAQLKTWMAAEGLSVLSPPVFAYFDPPWTPSFLRRNEVMLRTTSDSK